jgi:hypothetical protein
MDRACSPSVSTKKEAFHRRPVRLQPGGPVHFLEAISRCDEVLKLIRASKVAKAQDFPGSGYDMVTMFDRLHDMGDPVARPSM